MAKTALQTVEAMLGSLSLAELQDLHQTLHELEALIQAHAVARQPEVAQGQESPDVEVAGQIRGYIEHKMIPNKQHTRLYGPYAYLRVWRGGKHTSKYLGKVKPD
jgi:hypothetical protein